MTNSKRTDIRIPGAGQLAKYGLLILAVLVVIVSGHILSLDLAYMLLNGGFPKWTLLTLSGTGFVACAVTLIQLRYHRHVDYKLLTLALFALLSGHLMAAAFHKLYDGASVWWYAVVTASLVAAMVGAYSLRHALQRFHTFSTPRPTKEVLPNRNIQALVLLVSKNRFKLKWNKSPTAPQPNDEKSSGPSSEMLTGSVEASPQPAALDASKPSGSVAELCLDNSTQCAILTGVLAQDIEQTNTKPPWNWQQLLRAIEPFCQGPAKTKLKHIFLVSSSGDDGSHLQVDDCKKLLELYVGKGIIETGCNKNRDETWSGIQYCPVEFEDFDEIVELFVGRRGILTSLVNKFHIQPRDIIVDVTGGQKTASIAAAVITLNDDYAFQYVQTGEPYKPVIYDARFDAPPELGG